MRFSSRLGLGYKLGLAALALGTMMAACGTITVIEADGSADGATGSGGARNGGSGGAHVGTGGAHAGSGGSVAGAGGSGGTVGGGLGGTGAGGSNSGAGGAGTVSCSDIQKSFVSALAEAKGCVIGGTGYCGKTTLDRLDCGCPTYVSKTGVVDAVHAQWAQSGCSSGACPNTLCVVSTGAATCAVPPGGTSAICQDPSGLM